MKEKFIDAALIVTLIIVAFGITWTLLTLNRSDVRPPSTGEQVRGSEAGGTEITPIPIDPTAQDDPAPPNDQPNAATEPNPPSDQNQSTANRANEGQAGTQATDDDQDAAQDQATTPDPEPVPPGPVQLERVGFSYVTGGAGACGVVLEPWQHVAVSRELLAAYGCGAEVTLTLEDETGGRTEVAAVIADTMNPVHSRTVNVYVGEDEPALEYGVTSGVLRP